MKSVDHLISTSPIATVSFLSVSRSVIDSRFSCGVPKCVITVACTVTAADDLLIARLSANLSGAARIDLSICNQDRVELDRLTDIPITAATGAVLYQENIDFAKAAPVNTMIARLVAYDSAGQENLIGEYTFNHTPS